MSNAFSKFEAFVRSAPTLTEARSEPVGGLHPFDERNIHPKIDMASKLLYDDGHYSQATFEAYKLLDKVVQEISTIKQSGVKLMMQAFNEQSPVIKFSDLKTSSEKDEQEGYKFIFAGVMFAIRNPRGHEHGLIESPNQCLDHLSLASMLLRRLEGATLAA
jgi:uncharacterized protein (TIGR02391 family)